MKKCFSKPKNISVFFEFSTNGSSLPTYTKIPRRTRMRTDECPDRDEWAIALVMERGWTGDAEELASLMHRYVVDKVLCEWYAIVMPDMAAPYAAKADDDLYGMANVAREADMDGVRFML